MSIDLSKSVSAQGTDSSVGKRDDLTIGLKQGGETHREGHLIELTPDSVTVQFPIASAPHLYIGEDLELTFAASCWSSLIRVPASASARYDHGEHRRYDVQFRGDASSKTRLWRTLTKLLSSRRVAYRVMPTVGTVLRVTAAVRRADEMLLGGSSSGDDRHHIMEGELVDLSLAGAGIRLGGDVDRRLVAVDLLDVSLYFRAGEAGVPFTGWIRTRWHDGADGMRYGLQFDANLTADFQAKQTRLSEFILSQRTADGVAESEALTPSGLSPLEQAIRSQVVAVGPGQSASIPTLMSEIPTVAPRLI